MRGGGGLKVTGKIRKKGGSSLFENSENRGGRKKREITTFRPYAGNIEGEEGRSRAVKENYGGRKGDSSVDTHWTARGDRGKGGSPSTARTRNQKTVTHCLNAKKG